MNPQLSTPERMMAEQTLQPAAKAPSIRLSSVEVDEEHPELVKVLSNISIDPSKSGALSETDEDIFVDAEEGKKSQDQQQQQQQQQEAKKQQKKKSEDNNNDDDSDHDPSEFQTPLGDEQALDEKPIEELTPEELAARILKQVDFYFGDTNYPKDKFLRKQARLDPEGGDWISLEVVTNFKKMKKLTKDWQLVGSAVAASTVVVLNAAKTKIRRVNPIPKDTEDTLARTVVLEHIPKSSTVSILKALCESHGPVAGVRIHDPATQEIPADIQEIIEKYKAEGRDMLHPALQRGKPMVGLVEFQTHNDANKACKTLSNDNDWAKGLRATRLFRKDKDAKLGEEEGSKKKRVGRREDGESSESGWSSNVSSRTASPSVHLMANDTSQRPRASSTGSQSWRQERLHPAGAGGSNSGSINNVSSLDRDRALSMGHLERSKPGSASTPSSSTSSGTKRSPLGNHTLDRESRSAPGSAPTTPRTARRVVGAAGATAAGAAGAAGVGASTGDVSGPSALGGAASWRTESPVVRSSSPMPRQNDNIVRMPRGPEPGKSFGFGRGKPITTV